MADGDRIDKTAKFLYPDDAPTGLEPIVTFGDGSCLPRAVARCVFGDEEKFREIRVRIIVDAVLNSSHYLDEDYIS